jgi:hypothetical protein
MSARGLTPASPARWVNATEPKFTYAL